ncbi:MAG: ribosome small subunit-dependent GTPase A [Oscillospiraceae bacterium]|nr:ribosome small subunit-dependent GTPase A [Oscillospiraceae bacterium]
MNLTEYGWNRFFEIQLQNTLGMPARVTAVHKERYEIVCGHGFTHARLKSAVYYNDCAEAFPTTGDFVLIQHNPGGDSLIVKTLERKTLFSRRDPTPGRGEQAVAANFDYVFIMQSLNHDFNTKRLERYATQAWQSGAVPVAVMTKADLVEDFHEQTRAAAKIARGMEVVAVSVVSKLGLDALVEYLKPGKTIVFLGSSGVGKSSLVNALAGEDIMAVNTIREDDSRGRHTTTHRQLLRLQSGALLIDTPGMRELGMWDVSAGLGEAFADVSEFLGKCRFADCRHESEPGCAVRGAIALGELPAERWQSYLRLQKEAKYSSDRPAALREKKQWHKSIAKQNKQLQKNKARKLPGPFGRED